MDIINIEVLEDGTIKFETGQISGANHQSADDFFDMIEEHMSERKTTKKEISKSMQLRSYDRKLSTFQK